MRRFLKYHIYLIILLLLFTFLLSCQKSKDDFTGSDANFTIRMSGGEYDDIYNDIVVVEHDKYGLSLEKNEKLQQIFAVGSAFAQYYDIGEKRIKDCSGYTVATKTWDDLRNLLVVESFISGEITLCTHPVKRATLAIVFSPCDG